MVEVLIFAARGSLPANYGFGRHSMSSGFENFVRQKTDDDCERALHMAVRGNHLNVVKLVLQLDPGYPLEDTNRDFKSPIYIAAELGYKDILELLCESCSLEYTHGPRGESALHAAVKGLNTGMHVCMLIYAICLYLCFYTKIEFKIIVGRLGI